MTKQRCTLACPDELRERGVRPSARLRGKPRDCMETGLLAGHLHVWWHQARRSGHEMAERVMKNMGLQAVVRGRTVIATDPDAARPCPDDKVGRDFVADWPNR